MRWSALLPPLLLLALGLLTIYGPALRTGFDLAPGDAGDARIMIFLLENTWRALLAGRSPLSPPMFFPVPGVLGYSDAHLLWVPIYGALRLAGLAPVRAFSALFVALSAFGFLCGWRLLHRVLGLSSAAAAVGAFLFVFSNALTIKLGHGQMIGVTILPAILLLLHAAWARGRPWPAAAAGVLTGLLAATSYEVMWFFLFLGALATLLGLFAWPDFRAALRQPAAWRVGIGFAAGLAVGLVPFGIIYGPQILTGRHRAPGDASFYRPFLSDLLNLGDNHPVYKGVLAWFGLPYHDPDTDAERFMGSSVPVWGLAAAGLVLLWRGRREVPMPRRVLLLAAAAAILCTALEFKLARHVWPWIVVFSAVPGAAAIRTPFRSEIVALLPIAACAAVALDALLRRARGAVGRRAVMVAAFVLLSFAAMLESLWDKAPGGVSAAREAALVAGLPAPPAACRAFGLAPQPPGARQWWKLQSDALMFSLHWRLPTVNGNSSWTPPGWGLRQPASPHYAAALAGWVRGHRLGPALCAFRADQRRWLDREQLARLLHQDRGE